MKRIGFDLKIFIALFVFCITGIVISTVAIDKQIDSYIDEIKTEIHIVNNGTDEVTINNKDNKIIININPVDNITEKTETAKVYGIITSLSGLNIREKASINSQRVGVLEYGAKINILEDCGDWYRIDGGFIFKDYVIRI